MGSTQLRTVGKRASLPLRAGSILPLEVPGPHDGAPAPGENFTAVVTAIRWTTTAAALLVLSIGAKSDSNAVAGAAVLAYALWRTIRPVDVGKGAKAALVGVVSEAAVMVSVVVGTGYWNSPYVLCVFTVVSLAGFSGGVATAVPTAAVCITAIAIPYHLRGADPDIGLTVQWAGEIALVATVTGYARHITQRASEKTSAFLGRLQQLSEANGLLLQLHRVATTLPMSLDLSETLESSANRLRDLFEPDVMVILVREDAARWTVVRSSGLNLQSQLADRDLPPILAEAGAQHLPQLRTASEGAPFLGPDSTTGMYAPLWAREELVGLVAVERNAADPLSDAQLTLMEAFAQQMAVAIDNARWFSRIGTLAAERERNRIARDLHDSVGQSLALVGFELDRAAKSASEDEMRRQVQQLRETVKYVVAELRETLSDLRTDVSEEYGVSKALHDFVDRVERRSGLRVTLQVQAERRLPLAVERELWRIAQEAIANAERHAEAGSLMVVLSTGEHDAVLCVADDGKGMPSSDYRRPGGYGLLGMQERADAIGATLAVTSAPGAGTEVRVTLGR